MQEEIRVSATAYQSLEPYRMSRDDAVGTATANRLKAEGSEFEPR
jgi:hypothetical protein